MRRPPHAAANRPHPDVTPSARRRARDVIAAFTSLLLLALLTASCGAGGGGADSAMAAAQRYATAVQEQDYDAMLAVIDAEPVDDDERDIARSMLATLVSLQTGRYGPINDAVVLTPTNVSDDSAEVMIVWRHEGVDVAETFTASRRDDGWKLGNSAGPVEGRLEGERFVIAESSPAPAVAITPEPQAGGAGAGSGGAATSLPAVTPTPAPFTLRVQVTGIIHALRPITITLVERNETTTISLREGGPTATFRDLPVGRYTVRVSAPGTRDNDIVVEANGIQPPPSVLKAELGPAAPLDPARTVLVRGPYGGYDLLDLNGPAPGAYWQSLGIQRAFGWNADYSAMYVQDIEGVGSVDAVGRIAYVFRFADYEEGGRQLRRGSARPRPDFSELLFIRNNDLYSATAGEGAEPERWTRNGLVKLVLGYVDDDSAIVVGSDDRTYVVSRGGESYTLAETALNIFADERIIGDTIIFDPSGFARFALVGGNPLRVARVGPDQAADLGTLSYSSLGSRLNIVGWSPDQSRLLAYYFGDRDESDSGFYELDAEAGLRRVDDRLVPADVLSSNGALQSLDGSPEGPAAVVAWIAPGQEGLYTVTDDGARKVSDLAPDRVFWGADGLLYYVVEDGPERGTWRLVPGRDAEQVFAFVTTEVAALPDGHTLILANNSFWLDSGDGDPQLLGEEGAFDRYNGSSISALDPLPADGR